MTLSIRSSFRKREKYVAGFVVNVHDALNFDVDLSFTPSQHYHYRHIIYNMYKYKEESIDGCVNVGKAYRCRLKGVQLSSSKGNRNVRGKAKDLALAKTDMEHVIDRSNGWIVCKVGGVDIYNRLLVELVDPALYPDKIVFYKDILFNRYPKLFENYVPQKRSSKK